jgi:hypothetical protein
MDLPSKDLERIVVDKFCSNSDCGPGSQRCADCQDTVDAAVASTLAFFREKYPELTDAQITERFIHVK